MNDQQLMTAVGLVLQHGSIEVAARAGGIPVLQMGKLVEKAIAAGYLAKTDASERSRSRDQGVVHIPDTPKVTLLLGDLHYPFQHADVVPFVKACIDKYKPDEIVLTGDELDGHGIGRYPNDPNGYSAGHELEKGLSEIQALYAIIPNAKVCISNHGSRPYRKAFDSGLPAAFLKTYEDFMQAPPGWKWADEWIVDNVAFTHGESASGTNGALALAMRQGMSQAVGHWHGLAGSSFFHNGRQTVFGLYAGCLIDANAYCFAYGKHAKLKPIIGIALIDKGVPSFIPMPMDKRGRWTGRL